MTKIKTIKYQGRDYAQVKDRVQLFRKENPKGLIDTNATYSPDGTVIVKATVTKDSSVEGSPSASGQGFGKVENQKAFEKLETVAVGRALAFLGYGADGEIASADEMEEFIAFKKKKTQEAIKSLEACTTLEQLKKCFVGLGNSMAQPEVIAKKDEMKTKLAK